MNFFLWFYGCLYLVRANMDATGSAAVDTGKDVLSTFITGRIFPPEELSTKLWQTKAHVFLRGSPQRGFLRDDGSFVFTNVAPGSYIVEVTFPGYAYEPIRVEINSKGKIRARRVNYVQSSQVVQMPYPLKMKPFASMRYFQMREQWRITDFLFNPMVLVMILPVILIMILPRMMNDPEARKEMEQLGNLTNDVPEVSEFLTSWFHGNHGKPKPKQNKKSVKAS